MFNSFVFGITQMTLIILQWYFLLSTIVEKISLHHLCFQELLIENFTRTKKDGENFIRIKMKILNICKDYLLN